MKKYYDRGYDFLTRKAPAMKQFSPLLLVAGIVFGIFGLNACSTNPFLSSDSANQMNNQPKKIAAVSTSTVETASNESMSGSGAIGGNVAMSMDGTDKSKMSHALDNALGKSTTWTNSISDITYTVTPTEKVTINNNSFCRRYTIKAMKNGNEQNSTRTACVGADANWQEV